MTGRMLRPRRQNSLSLLWFNTWGTAASQKGGERLTGRKARMSHTGSDQQERELVARQVFAWYSTRHDLWLFIWSHIQFCIFKTLYFYYFWIHVYLCEGMYTWVPGTPALLSQGCRQLWALDVGAGNQVLCKSSTSSHPEPSLVP